MVSKNLKADSSKKGLSDEDKQRLAVEFELMRQEVTNIDKQINELQLKQVELMTIKQGIESIKDCNGKELLVPLGVGLYINSKLTNDKSALVNVGAGVIIEKSLDQANKLIDEQVDSITQAVNELDANAEDFVNKMHEIEETLSV